MWHHHLRDYEGIWKLAALVVYEIVASMAAFATKVIYL